MIKRAAVAVVLTFSLTVLTGCHTVHGLGQDIESGGKAIQKSTGK